MTLTTPEIAAILVLFVVVVFFLAGLWYLRRRFAERRRQLTGEIADSAARTEERAHNRILLDEAELATLEREGFEVSRAKGFLADARSAFARSDYHHALQIAQSVHDSLVKLRLAGPAVGEAGSEAIPESGADVEDSADPVPARAAAPGGSGSPAGRPPLPKNRLESRFQITLLTDELAEAVRTRPADPALAEAKRLATEASGLEGREEYTEALRIALRARRTLGGKIETLPNFAVAAPAPGVEGSPGGEPVSASPSGRVRISRASPEAIATSVPARTCRSCQRPLREGDAYCRACGTPVAGGGCPKCGNPIEPSDRFCAVCGSPVAGG